MTARRNDFVSTKGILELLDTIPSLLLITYYLLLEPFPSGRTSFVGNLNHLMNGLVNLFPIARSNYNTSLTIAS